MSLPELLENIKSFRKTLENRAFFFILLLILTGFLSFGLGRLYQIEASRTPLKIYYATSTPTTTDVESDTETVQPATVSVVATVIASRNGTRYHFLHCSGARTISEQNKITFGSEKEAQAAGYTLAANCKPK